MYDQKSYKQEQHVYNVGRFSLELRTALIFSRCLSGHGETEGHAYPSLASFLLTPRARKIACLWLRPELRVALIQMRIRILVPFYF